MKTISYYSTATKMLNDQQLQELVDVSITKNSEFDISGILLFAGGCFFQIIEGPDVAIDKLYDNIKNDIRHKNVITVLDSKIETRRFSNWSMGCINLTSKMSKNDAIFKLSEQALNNKVTFADNDVITILAKTFYESIERVLHHSKA